MVSREAGEHVSGIRDKILDDVQARLLADRPLPGFLIDSISRMHPLDISSSKRGECVALDEFDEDDLRSMEPERAWLSYNYFITPTVAPYKTPIHLYHRTKLLPEVGTEKSVLDILATLVNQRRGLKRNAVFTGPIVSQELYNGETDSISVKEAARGMLTYHSITVPYLELTKFQAALLDTTDDRYPEAATNIEGFSPEIIICIPVANGQEWDTLPKTLKLLAEQSLDHDKYEIVLLHNSVEAKDAYDNEGIDDGVANEAAIEHEWLSIVYNKLLDDYPNLKIRADLAVHAPSTTIGFCRMRLGQQVASKYIERGSTNNPLLLNMDADIRSLNKDFLKNMLATAEQTDAPVITSRLRWQADKDANIGPNSAKLLKLGLFLNATAQAYMNAPNFIESGTAIRMKEYCLSGGHYWTQMLSETIQITQLLNVLRKKNDQGPAITMSRGSIIGSDPRRQIDVLARGHSTSKAWSRELTTFGQSDDPVRTQRTPYEEAEMIATAELERLVMETIEDVFGDTKSEAFQAKSEVVRKGLSIIGLPVYEI